MTDLFDSDEEISGGGFAGNNAIDGAGSYNKAALRGCGSYNKAALKGCGSYNKAALRGCGSYNKAALRGCGSYDKAALKGCGSYNKAALRGCGRGSGPTYDETKPQPDNLTEPSMLGNFLSGIFGGKVVKGSEEAKARMAYLRSLRTGKRTPKKRTTGGSILAKLLPMYKDGVTKWGSRILSDRASQIGRINELTSQLAKKKGGKAMLSSPALEKLRKQIMMKKLRNTRGGKFETKDIVDFFAGPIGWAAMGMRKKRERQIADLEKQLNGGAGLVKSVVTPLSVEESKRELENMKARIREMREELGDDDD